MISFTRQQMIDVLRRTCDESWLTSLLADPNSEAVLNAAADIWARVSVAADRDASSALISLAPAGAPGTAMITVTATVLGGILPAGTSLVDARGYLYVTQADVPLVLNVPTTFAVRSLRQIEIVNSVDDPDLRFTPVLLIQDATNAAPVVVTITAPHGLSEGQYVRLSGVTGNLAANGIFAITLVGVTDPARQFKLVGSAGSGTYTGEGFVQAASFALGTALGVRVDSTTPVAGASSDWLSVLGRERGVQRQAFEDDGAYRARIRNIPDVVSPRAISEAVYGAVQRGNLPDFLVLEPEEDGSTLTLDQSLGLGSFSMAYWDEFFWDDGLFVSRREACAYFKLRATAPPKDPDGLRPFWDSMFFDDPLFGYLDVTDHPKLIAALMAMWQDVYTKRAACVQFDIDLTFERVDITTGSSNVDPPTVIWALPVVPLAAGKGLWLRSLVVGHFPLAGSTYPVAPGEHYHQVRFTFEDATTYTTPPWPNSDGEPDVGSDAQVITPEMLYAAGFTKRITRVEGILKSDGTQTLGITGVLRTLEVTL